MKPKQITPGELLRDFRRKYKMKQAELSRRVQCSKAMICMIEGGERVPSQKLAREIVNQFPLGPVKREGLLWYLTRKHHLFERLKHEYPNTFEDFRASWLREDQNRT